MERAEFLKRMRSLAESLYDHFAPYYWDQWGSYDEEAHRKYMAKFLDLLGPPAPACQSVILSAACGAGRFDGILMEAGYSVVGTDQSAGVLARAREHFPVEQYPQLRYEQIGMQEMALDPAFHGKFDGVICMDAMEHICPEDWPGIVRGFQVALKPGGYLYFTADVRDAAEVRASYERALAQGLPVVYGDIADQVEEAARRALETGEVVDECVYHYSPPLEQITTWLEQAGLAVVEIGQESVYHHIITVNRTGKH